MTSSSPHSLHPDEIEAHFGAADSRRGPRIEELQGVRLHAFGHYLRLVEEGRLDVSSLITHRFRLEQFREAFLVMHTKARHNAVKAVFDFGLEEGHAGG